MNKEPPHARVALCFSAEIFLLFFLPADLLLFRIKSFNTETTENMNQAQRKRASSLCASVSKVRLKIVKFKSSHTRSLRSLEAQSSQREP
jgi:hypothetical protein